MHRALNVVQECLAVRSHPKPWTSQRFISTNTAIHRGIRKSRDGPGTRYQGHRNEAFQSEHGPPRERLRRPNHQQRQDVEDMEESARMNVDRMSAKKRNYLQGGSRERMEFSRRGSSDRNTRRPSVRESTGRDFSRRAGGYESTRPPTSTSFASDRGHRADLRDSSRRTSSFPDRSMRQESTELNDESFEREPHKVSRETSSRQRSYRLGDDDTPEDARISDRPRGGASRGREFEHFSRHDEGESFERKSKDPLSIPYTTPASEFLYGTSVITAALKSSRRKLYKLYIYDGQNREVQAQDASIRKLAFAKGVTVHRVQRDWLRFMDKMSNGRPHNGYILESSPLPKLPVFGLQHVQKQQDNFGVSLDHQSSEEAAVNGNNSLVKYNGSSSRYPFIVLLDGILDPGNLGAILRTAYFLGVDALAVSNRNSAPFTPVALKASAGASENLPLMTVSQPGAFIDESQKNGWKFYAAVAPSVSTGPTNSKNHNGTKTPYFSTSNFNCPLKTHPCVLMLGGEGEGLRWNLQKKADYLLGVDGYRVGLGGVDSLNVSVAAGLLCEAFMRKPVQSPVGVIEASREEDGRVDSENRLF